jgi:membrane protein required for colicin V production
MQPYDIAMLIVLVGATLFGFLKGMAWQIASLASLIASYFVALRLSPVLASHIGLQPPLNKFVAMGAIYLGTSMAIWLAFRVVAGLIDRVRLNEFDRQIGGLFGAAKGALLCIVITLFAVAVSDQTRTLVLQSKSGYYIAHIIDRAEAVMPPEVHQVLGPYLDQFEEQMKSGAPAGQTATAGGRLPF